MGNIYGYESKDCHALFVSNFLLQILNVRRYVTEAGNVCCRDFTISYLATDDTGEDVYLSLLSDWDLDAAFFSASSPCLRLKVDLKPFEPGIISVYFISLILVTCV